MKKYLLILPILISYSLTAQVKNDISIDNIYDQTFNQKRVRGINWMQDGRYYSTLVSNSGFDLVLKYDITSGELIDTLVDGRNLGKDAAGNLIRFSEYQLNKDESKALLQSQREKIYRRSFKAQYYVYDIGNQSSVKLTNGGKQGYATFSPDGSKVAFTRDNNLHFVTLETMDLTSISSNGEFNKIINGSCDWVYEEEFSFIKAFFWSPNSEHIAYYTFDETDVALYNVQIWGDLYPQDYIFKYPKAGEKNSQVSISVYSLEKNSNKKVDTGQESDVYFPRIQWTSNPNLLSISRLNRLQNHMEILHANIDNGSVVTILEEKSASYVDTEYNDLLIYLEDGASFLATSEMDGYKHIYHYDIDGNLIRQVTSGDWEASKLLGMDQKKSLVYLLSTEDSPLERHLYSVKINGKGKTKLTSKSGVHGINFSPDYKYYIQDFNSLDEPLAYTVHNNQGKNIRLLEDNSTLMATYKKFNTGTKELIKVAANGVDLNGYLIKPENFDPTKKYPLLMFLYGGPGSQQVMNRWNNSNDYWHRMLAGKGYLVACVDNRGTGARGKDFKHITYGQLGKYEVEDQLEAARYFGDLDYVDSDRIGIWGWSYGGYMSSLAVFLGNKIFKMGIAVAPVTNWKYYDTIYTERYLKRPQENETGYEAFSPINHVGKLESEYLLIHGSGDDNVHVQNSIELVDELIRNNKPFQHFYYPNRTHGISGGNTRVHLYNMMTRFVIEKL